jgi:hypothetical protein
LRTLCEDFLPKKVAAILYLANSDDYHRSGVATTQYFIQLAVYLRIPVITWNADNPVMEKVRKLSVLIGILLCMPIVEIYFHMGFESIMTAGPGILNFPKIDLTSPIKSRILMHPYLRPNKYHAAGMTYTSVEGYEE